MDDGSLSGEIRKRRQELGLSLADLARRVGTSAAAISRYEGGWQRFEVETLRKIAVALGCRLNIDLKPVELRRKRVSAGIAAAQLKGLFWDHDLTAGDFKRHPRWITERVLEYGSLEDVRTLVALMGRHVFLKLVAESRLTTGRTERFWRAMLEMEGVECTKRSFQRGAWHS
ncbi:MAG: helix-turn-helix transcriptional regulator [Proteobacteria bacterium]|nr:helix-turn-helix transcriptional regulator [Pseudomonadota bacterium]